MNILLLEYSYTSALFRRSLNKAFPGANILGISEFRGVSDIWYGDWIYSADYDYENGADYEVKLDIIRRDRAFCRMQECRAITIVNRMWNGIERLFTTHQIDLVVSVMIDRAASDILARVSKIYEVPFASPTGTFIPGYARFTTRGERIDLPRLVTDEETATVLSTLLNNQFLPISENDQKEKSRKKHALYYQLRRLAIEGILDPIRRIGDPDAHQYNVKYTDIEAVRSIFSNEYDSLFSHVSDLNYDKDAVYFPLHVVPEATTIYWCDGVESKGYLKYVTDVIDSSDEQVHFLVKEHPSMYGRRNPSFYFELGSRSNVTLIHPLDRSNELLGKCNTVLADNGSVGVEALLRGNRVLCFQNNYYQDLHPNCISVQSVNLELLHCPVVDFPAQQFMQGLLCGFFPSDFRSTKKQINCSAEQLAQGFQLFWQRFGNAKKELDYV